MPRKRLPIFQKVSKILKVSIFVAKMRKPRIPRLALFVKSQKLRKFKLLQNKHYNYRFIAEYEFSPSKTRPLIRNYRREDQFKFKLNHASLQRVYSMLFLCRCLRGEADNNVGDLSLQLEALPAVDYEDRVEGALFKPLDWGGDDKDEEGEEEDSVDLRAERFIEKFYEEMRMQVQASL